MITSFVDGRLRIRDNELKKSSVANALREALLKNHGISEVTANQRVGSFLVVYDKAATSISKVLSILKAYLTVDEEEGLERTSYRTQAPIIPLPQLPLTKRKMIKIGMIASFAVSLAGAALDIEKLHVASGLVFVAVLVGGHLVDKRKVLFA